LAYAQFVNFCGYNIAKIDTIKSKVYYNLEESFVMFYGVFYHMHNIIILLKENYGMLEW
jgi:hypothetical protein